MSLTVQDVQAFIPQLAPDATPPSEVQVQAALDWADEQLEVAATPQPAPDSRQGRALLTAVSAYALALSLGGKARATLAAGNTSAAKKVEIGPIKLEKTAVDAQASAQSSAGAAQGWLDLAFQQLGRTGLPPHVTAFPGVAL